MNILVTILLVPGSIIILLLIIALLTKKEFSIEREITVNCTKADVFNYARMLKNQEQYSVWVMKDPNVQIVYTGTDGTVGAMSAWKSDDRNVGVGEQEIKKIHEDESIETEVRFKKPFEDTNNALTTVKDAGNGQTIINTRFYGRNKFPKNLMNLVLDKMLGKDMRQNLENLKNNLEK